MAKSTVPKLNSEAVTGEVIERHGIAFNTLDRSKAGRRIDPDKPAVYGNKKGGSGYKITERIVNTLERAFMQGASVTEACAIAGISRTIYYRWIKENPDFIEHIETLQSIPTMKARTNIVDSINDGNIDVSRWYLERKARDEFGNKAEIAVNSSVGLNLDDAKTSAENLIKAYLNEQTKGE